MPASPFAPPRPAAPAPSSASTPPAENPEPFGTAKEITHLFADRGAYLSYRYVRALMIHCPHTVRGRYIRFSDAWTWWHTHPQFQPFCRRRRK